MSTDTGITQLLGSRATTLPRVNLLPPEIGEQRTYRRQQLAAGGTVATAVGVVGLLFLAAASGQGAAQSRLDAAGAEHARLTTAIQTYDGVTATYSRASSEQAMLTTAMGDEVRFSQLLNDLGVSVPSRVWLKSLTLTTGNAPGAPAAPVAGGAPAIPAAPAGIGTLTVTGVAFSHDDVAAWLTAVAALKTYANPALVSSTEALIGTRPTAGFSSTATLTAAAESGRYTNPAGG